MVCVLVAEKKYTVVLATEEFNMNKKQQKELNKLKYHEQNCGYIALSDYSSYYYLTSLDKIIKLKNENRVLCSRRKALLKSFNSLHTTTIQEVDVRLLHRKTHDQFIKSIAKLSEQIGRNGHKIQRLRTKYKQYGEKWKDSKLRPKDSEVICY